MANAPRFPGRDDARRGRSPDWLDDEPSDSFPTAREQAAPRRHSRDRAGGGRVPRLTLPSIPILKATARPNSAHEDTGRRRTLLAATGRQRVVRPDPSANDEPDAGPASMRSRAMRRREQSSARPLTYEDDAPAYESDEYAEYAWDDEPNMPSERHRALVPYTAGGATADVPDLAAYRALQARPRHAHLDTRALVRRARSPWSITRLVLAVASISLALFTAFTGVGEAHQPLMDAFQTTAGSHEAKSVTSLVQPETQGTRPDLYDSQQQFNDWWNAACSSATSSEVLTAWGVKGATIGKLIDVMQPDVSLYGGLLRPEGYQRGAAAFGYRADLKGVPGRGDPQYSYQQILYIANTLAVPVIVNVRISWGYYHFFDGGHFLVVTGGDDQGLKIVDSSEYYIHYLSKDVFYSMFTGMTVVMVPSDYHYTVPSV